ncbi:hypothetical protein PR202_ga19613 [Eleusine coracana subsp. coracana]|uniref:Uncharacterized protein n=1 Tax=Eleusine coracana subsp. coracana TaxID=191504 RepID=A0AAV5CUJ2_ELECO|nr:hypothetical protein PR202_ga19613 [Eleusine coracana subsp. coracana]
MGRSNAQNILLGRLARILCSPSSSKLRTGFQAFFSCYFRTPGCRVATTCTAISPNRQSATSASMATTSFFHPLAAPVASGGARLRRCPLTLPVPARTTPRRPAPLFVVRAKRADSRTPAAASRQAANSSAAPKRDAEEEVEVEEEMPWIQDKALDLVEFTGTVTQAIPGPRVGSSPVPWLLAVPLAYVGVSFVLAVVRTVRRFTSPRTKKKRRVGKNIFLLKSLDELFQKGREAVDYSALQDLMQKLPEFCSRDSSLVVKEIFGVTDSEDADSIRMHTHSATGDIESLEKMVDDSDLEHGSSPST